MGTNKKLSWQFINLVILISNVDSFSHSGISSVISRHPFPCSRQLSKQYRKVPVPTIRKSAVAPQNAEIINKHSDSNKKWKYLGTNLLIGLNILSFICQSYKPRDPPSALSLFHVQNNQSPQFNFFNEQFISSSTFTNDFSLDSYMIEAHGQNYRYISYSFLHSSIAHLLITLWNLKNFAYLYEGILGTSSLLGVYIFGAISASCLELSAIPCRSSVISSSSFLSKLLNFHQLFQLNHHYTLVGPRGATFSICGSLALYFYTKGQYTTTKSFLFNLCMTSLITGKLLSPIGGFLGGSFYSFLNHLNFKNQKKNNSSEMKKGEVDVSQQTTSNLITKLQRFLRIAILMFFSGTMIQVPFALITHWKFPGALSGGANPMTVLFL